MATLTEKIKELKDLVLKFTTDVNLKFIEVKTADGAILNVEGETLAVGAMVKVVTPDGMVEAPDGEHMLEDGQTIVTEGGAITDIKPATEPAAADMDKAAEEFAALTKRLEESEAKYASLEKMIADLSAKFDKVGDFNKQLLTVVEGFADLPDSPPAQPKKHTSIKDVEAAIKEEMKQLRKSTK